MCVCVRACMRACVRVLCVRVRVHVRATACILVCWCRYLCFERSRSKRDTTTEGDVKIALTDVADIKKVCDTELTQHKNFLCSKSSMLEY